LLQLLLGLRSNALIRILGVDQNLRDVRHLLLLLLLLLVVLVLAAISFFFLFLPSTMFVVVASSVEGRKESKKRGRV